MQTGRIVYNLCEWWVNAFSRLNENKSRLVSKEDDMARDTAPKAGRILKQDLIRTLLLEMFRGELRSGDRLIEVALAKRFDVSRTPVREALMGLSAIGLVELRPNCGAVMRPFGLEQIREIYDVREILEGEACRRACGKIAPAVLEEIRLAFENLRNQARHDKDWSHAEWVVDCRLHETIVQHSGNKRLAEEVATYGELIQIVRETVGNARRMQEQAIGEHLEIVDALLRNKPEAAATAMRRHIHSAANCALESLRDNFADRPVNAMRPKRRALARV